jgi:hypothetical protein
MTVTRGSIKPYTYQPVVVRDGQRVRMGRR